jgi:hypothetical protein
LNSYLDILEIIIGQIDPKTQVNRQGGQMNMLESLKNLMIGKVHMPHS